MNWAGVYINFEKRLRTFALGLDCKKDYHLAMEFFSRLLLLCLFGWGSVFAQSNLPACQGGNTATWSNCWGTFTFPGGDRIVSEYQNGMRNGQGIEYAKNGSVLRSGTWKNDQLVSSYVLDKSRFPFDPQALTVATNNQSTNFSVVSAFSQSNLLDCQGANSAKWSNCLGTFTFPGGDRVVSEYQNGMRNGKGIEYDKNGSVLRLGTWKNGVWVDPRLAQSEPVQQASETNSELVRLRAETEEAKRKQAELEQQLRIAQQQAPQITQNPPVTIQTAITYDKRVALVIGNAAYKVNPLKNPVNDSTDMARSLRSVGFDVIEANNTTLAQMREATRRFSDKLGNSDVGLVYYSGHGVEVKGKNYLIPVNADIKREYEVVDQAFDASQFLEMMDNIRGPNNKRVNILIVDACRNNELQKSWRSTNNGLARMDAPGGTFISFATAPGRVAADGVGRNSPYTKHLLQALKQPNVPIEQVFKVVRRNVMEETKGEQIPWENSSLVGDFYFTVQR